MLQKINLAEEVTQPWVLCFLDIGWLSWVSRGKDGAQGTLPLYFVIKPPAHLQRFWRKNLTASAGSPGLFPQFSAPPVLSYTSLPNFTIGSCQIRGFLGGSDGKESACSAGDRGSTPGLGRSAGEREWQPTPVFLPGESYEQRSLVGYRPCCQIESSKYNICLDNISHINIPVNTGRQAIP